MDWQQFGHQMASMARDLLAQPSVDATVKRITDSAHDLVEGCDAAGILLLEGRKATTLAPTHEMVTQCDQLQAHLKEGPCFDAARRTEEERVFRISDFTQHDARWPSFVPAARDLGIGSMMGFLLYTEDEDLGALNFYCYEPGVFTEVSEAAGWLLASHAAVALSSSRTYAQMEQAIATRHQIGEAMGILMSSHHLTEEQAFDVLRRYSQDKNIKLREVARRLCETGLL
ncbi:ANTAR domain-containing protein [Streptomyces sp. SID8366]|uniref:GAF and ANTAR domain-containing protein n=1 Tax=unclassified Streptomyces TaxID=2593676 RepID=UPI000DBA4AAC|nr:MULTISPECIES: GAF and ANTAR domain-containing protein [unclassified Streptomyces]MYU06096.1 ANTAR domain-containing protein [Streptomyces sp. SID8366]MYU61669.1 ANTAR domain-containing protein [Streptomyces sp. SID69]RAJ64164.1 GAF domain-containing protein [Streptomyces sp. PsTaAH-130]